MSDVPGVRVPLIPEDEATGRTAELYANIKAVTKLPFVPDMFRLTSTRPDLLNVVSTGYQGIFLSEDAVLPRKIRELIAAWSSNVNGCPYCVGTHNWFLSQFGGSDELVAAVWSARNLDELPLDEKTHALLRLVTKVCQAAYKVTDEDWEATSEAGWNNDEILEAIFTASLFAFINRMVDATGLGTSVTQSRISQQSNENTDAA
jgi:uncharacterized peroxidase-related enzyme